MIKYTVFFFLLGYVAVCGWWQVIKKGDADLKRHRPIVVSAGTRQ
jgi:hypothetical protein